MGSSAHAPRWRAATAVVLATPAAVLLCRWTFGRLAEVLRRRRQGRGGSCRLQDPLWRGCGLSAEEVNRFGRQIVLPKLGVEGQKRLLSSTALVVGAGGLGCPVALYLCAAGLKGIGIADGDQVAVSNLHRQIGHATAGVGINKAISLQSTCQAVNPTCEVVAHAARLESLADATALVARYDIVVDCTDAPGSRHLLNAACVASGRPLVAPSAVGLSGQLAVYNYDGGPCLCCVFPVLPRGDDEEEPLASCEENGVLGPVPGILGTLAALETLKLLAGGALAKTCLSERMLLYDSLDSAQPCRSMKIRRRDDCAVCGPSGGGGCAGGVATTVTCAPCSAVPRPSEGLEISANALRQRLHAPGAEAASCGATAVVDVRAPSHFAVAHLAIAENWPLPEMLRTTPEEVRRRAEKMCPGLARGGNEQPTVVCVCRRGVDSLRAARRLREAGIQAVSLAGGLQAFARESEPDLEAPRLT